MEIYAHASARLKMLLQNPSHQLKVGVLAPTTWQLVEKYGALFPEGIEVVGQLSDDHHYWNDYRRKMREWKDLAMNVSLNLEAFEEIDFSQYDLLIESAETFSYSRDWKDHCERIECPLLLKACWTGKPLDLLPSNYIKRVKNFPVLLEMPAHVAAWRSAGFTDVNAVFNPVGEWWFQREWTGEHDRVLFVLSGANAWRGDDKSAFGLEIWDKLKKEFPRQAYHHDGDESYMTSLQMTALFAESRVFINLDRPFGQGERPLTIAFTEALSAGLPVVARDLPGLNYGDFIDTNGVCTNDYSSMVSFIRKCLTDYEYAKTCGLRSRQIAQRSFSTAVLKPKYEQIIERAITTFNSTR